MTHLFGKCRNAEDDCSHVPPDPVSVHSLDAYEPPVDAGDLLQQPHGTTRYSALTGLDLA